MRTITTIYIFSRLETLVNTTTTTAYLRPKEPLIITTRTTIQRYISIETFAPYILIHLCNNILNTTILINNCLRHKWTKIMRSKNAPLMPDNIHEILCA